MMCFDNANGIQVVESAESFRSQWSQVLFVLRVSRYDRFRCGKEASKGPIPPFYAHGSGVIVQLAEPEPDPVTMTPSVMPWAVSDRGGNRGQSVVQGPREAHKGPGGATRARPTRAQGGPQGPGPQGPRGAHKGPAHKGPGGPTRAWPTRAQGIVALWQGHRARAKATTRIVVHRKGGMSHLISSNFRR